MKGYVLFFNNTAMDSKITVKLVDTLNKISNRTFSITGIIATEYKRQKPEHNYCASEIKSEPPATPSKYANI